MVCWFCHFRHLHEYLSWYIRLQRTGKRDEIFLASKFGVTFDPETGVTSRGDREYVKEAADRALKTLGVDTIDLYYLHRQELMISLFVYAIDLQSKN